jgi:hypothetical protein
MILKFSIVLTGFIYRSKFNVPLGVESQATFTLVLRPWRLYERGRVARRG